MGRDWKGFNDAWRDRAGERALATVLTALSDLALATERLIKRLEPLGILLAVIGLAVSIIAFQIDYADRTVERKLRAWEIITAAGPANGGKYEALEFLTSDGRDVSGARLSRAILAYRNFADLNLLYIDLSRADLSWTDLSRTKLSWANLVEADLTNANLSGADLEGANLSGAQLFMADFIEAYLLRSNLSGANLNAVDLIGAKLYGADASGAYFRRADFRRAGLNRADFSGTKLSRADFRGADLFAADFSEADFSEVDLSGAKNLEQSQLDEACGDERTNLPDGLTIPLCSDVDWYERAHGPLTPDETAASG